jgi:hypothetical protein
MKLENAYLKSQVAALKKMVEEERENVKIQREQSMAHS